MSGSPCSNEEARQKRLEAQQRMDEQERLAAKFIMRRQVTALVACAIPCTAFIFLIFCAVSDWEFNPLLLFFAVIWGLAFGGIAAFCVREEAIRDVPPAPQQQPV